MSGPWTAYQQQSETPPAGPWTAYQAPVAEGPGWLPGALARGVGNLVGAPRDVADMAGQGAAYVAGAAGEMASRDSGLVGAAARALRNAAPTQAQIDARVAQSPMLQGAQRLAAEMPRTPFPTGAEAGRFIIDQFGIPDQPAQTPEGRVGAEAVSTGVASMLPGRAPVVARDIAIGSTVGAASGVAREAGQGDAGALVAGLGTAGGIASLQALRGMVGRTAERALAGVSVADFTRAERLMQDAAAAGMPITALEAIQAVTGQNLPMQDLQRFLERSIGGGPVLAPMMQGRPAGNATAFERVAPPRPARVDTVGPEAQRAAEGAMVDAMSARTAAVTPLYRSAANAVAGSPQLAAQVQAAGVRALNDIDASIAGDSTGLLRGAMGPERDMLANAIAASDFEGIDRAFKAIRDRVELPAQPGVPAIESEIAGRLMAPLNAMRADLRAIVPDYDRAIATYERISRDTVEPLAAGPVGRISRTAMPEAQGPALLPAAPTAAGVDETVVRDALARLRTRNPQAARDLISLYLRNTFEEATQRLASGPNVAGGAKFAAVVSGNSEQARNLEAAIRAGLPNGDAVWTGFRRFLDVLDAQQFRAAANSATDFNAAIRAEGRALPGIQVPDWMREVLLGRRTAELARLISTPDNLNRLRTLGRIDGDSPAVRTLVIGLLASARSGGQSNGQAPTTGR